MKAQDQFVFVLFSIFTLINTQDIDEEPYVENVKEALLIEENQQEPVFKEPQLRRLDRAYSRNWACGQCLQNGYKSCVQTPTDHYILSKTSSTPGGWTTSTFNLNNPIINTCCAIGDPCYYTYSNYACTEAYNNTLYAKYTCPFNTDSCGLNDTYLFDDIGQSQLLNLNMKTGDVCFFKIKNTCGILKTEILSVNDSSNIIAEYIEFDEDEILLETREGTSNSNLGGGPGKGMPWRVETFAYDDNRKIFQGRIFPDMGAHYWGSASQGKEATFPKGATGQDCRNRDSYLIFTSVSSLATAKVQIQLESMSLKQLVDSFSSLTSSCLLVFTGVLLSLI